MSRVEPSRSKVGPVRPWLRLAVDLVLVATFAVGYYLPYLQQQGIPYGDFPSDVAVGEAGHVLSVWSLPIWQPALMCGRPTLDFPSPWQLLALPFASIEPLLRAKVVVVLYHVLAGWAMYWLLTSLHAGRASALFAGLIYPIMVSHVTRSSHYGHMHVVMMFAVLPVIFVALLRLRAGAYRHAALLALILAAGFMRDTQRTVLISVVIGFVLCLLLLPQLVAVARVRSWRPARRGLWVLALFALAFCLAVAIDAFELLNSHIGDPYRGGWRDGEQQEWVDRWSVDNLFTLIDRDAVIGRKLSSVSDLFYESHSRYVGVSLVLLILVGALDVRGMGRQRQRFALAVLVLVVSFWLSFGHDPVWPHVQARWSAFFAASSVPWWSKAGLIGLICGFLLAVATALRRRFGPSRRSWLWAWLATGSGIWLFLKTAPLEPLTLLLFFLREFRNPDWFGVIGISFGAVLAAALTVSALARRFFGSAYWPLGMAALVALVVWDLHPYRRLLSDSQSSTTSLTHFRQAGEAIAADPGDFRVLPGHRHNGREDLTYIWHRKRLAWDFRSYTAPRRTLLYMDVLYHQLYSRSPAFAAELAGIANVKYIVEQSRRRRNIRSTALFEKRLDLDRVSVLENLSYRPWLQAYPRAAVLAGEPAPHGVGLVARLAIHDIGVIQAEDPALTADLTPGRMVFIDRTPRPGEVVPADALLLQRLPPTPVDSRPFVKPPRLEAARPRPHHIVIDSDAVQDYFLVVSESFHPWWSATLDGQPTTVHPGQFAFLGLLIPGGKHRVELTFARPWTFYLWAVVGGTSLLSTVAYLAVTSTVVRRWRRRRAA